MDVCFVGVVLDGQSPESTLDVALVCVARDAEDLVVVLLLAALEEGLCFVEEFLQFLRVAVDFLGFIQGSDGGFEVVRIELALCLAQESGKAGGVVGEGFVAVSLRLLDVVLSQVSAMCGLHT